MIEAMSGAIGNGKTYYAVAERITHHLGVGGLVVTNIALNFKELRARVLRKHDYHIDKSQIIILEPEQVPRFPRFTPAGNVACPTMVVIDEAHIWLAATNGNRAQDTQELLTFLTQSRKVSVDVIFISQSLDNVDVRVRRLVARWWRFRNLRNWKIPLLGCRYPFNHLQAVEYDADNRTAVGNKMHVFEPEVFRCYNTYQLLRGFEMAAARGKGGRAALKLSPWVWGGSLAGIVALVGVGYLFTVNRAGAQTNRVPSQVSGATNRVEHVRPTEYRSERIVAWRHGVLVTTMGEYEINKPCAWGRVVAVGPSGAAVERWDKSMLFVVPASGTDWGDGSTNEVVSQVPATTRATAGSGRQELAKEEKPEAGPARVPDTREKPKAIKGSSLGDIARRHR